ncbi:MAG: hypothetical protein SPL62_11090 [Selenomonas sp.]|nr:hypothetical protein [Selenomonas sp.]
MMQKLMKALGMYVCLLFLLGTHVVYAGQPLSTETDCKTFGSQFNGAVSGIDSMNDYLFKTIYPETDKKEMRLSGLGLPYDNGTLFFLETKIPDAGVYVSFNGEGYLDALLVEIPRKNVDSYNKSWFVLVGTLFAEKLVSRSSSGLNQALGDKMRQVLSETLSYFDIYTDKGFYVRIKGLSNSEFYRVAIFRSEAE